MVGSRTPFATSSSQLSPTAPVPVLATPANPADVVVTFSEPLVNANVNDSNWTAVIGGTEYEGDGVGVIGGVVHATLSPSGFGSGPDRITYSAAIPDLFGAVSGLPVAAFSNFPIT